MLGVLNLEKEQPTMSPDQKIKLKLCCHFKYVAVQSRFQDIRDKEIWGRKVDKKELEEYDEAVLDYKKMLEFSNEQGRS